MNTFFAWSIGLLVIFFQATEAQWRQTSGPWGGTISSFAMGCGAILAGSDDNGVFRSTDGGASWTPADSGIPVTSGGWRSVTALAAHGNIFFAGTRSSGVLRSTDNGSCWTAANSGITNTNEIQALLAGDSGIFVVVDNRLFRSIDDGEHWTPAGGSCVDGGCIIANGNSLLFSGIGEEPLASARYQGVWLSRNCGETWTPVDSGLPDKSVMAMVAGDGAVFASTNSGVFRSIDNGVSWTAVNSGLTGDASFYNLYYPLLMSGASLFAATDSGIFRSTNQGASWTKINSELSRFRVMSFAANGNTLFAGTVYAGIFRSTDNGLNWDPVNSGLRSTKIIRTLSVAGGILLAGNSGWPYDMFSSADSGLHWNDIASSFTNDSFDRSSGFKMIQGGAVFATTLTSGNIFLSTTGGASWTQVESGLLDSNKWKYELRAFTSNASALFIGTTTGAVRSTDSGVTWSEPDTTIHEYPIYSLLSKNGRIIAGTNEGVLVSSDSAMSWEKASFGLLSMRVESLAACGDALFAGSSYDGVFRSGDNGETWKAVNSGLANTSVFSLISHDSTLFAGTFGDGVFLSTDNGVSWRAFNDGLDDKRVYSLAVCGGELFAGTEGYGIWHRPLSETGVIPDRLQGKAAFRQAGFDLLAPRAANSLLTITFSLPCPDHVAITLYSLSGKSMASIFKGRVGTGTYSIQWDTRAVARGCYVIRMQAGGTNSAAIVRFDR